MYKSIIIVLFLTILISCQNEPCRDFDYKYSFENSKKSIGIKVFDNIILEERIFNIYFFKGDELIEERSTKNKCKEIEFFHSDESTIKIKIGSDTIEFHNQ